MTSSPTAAGRILLGQFYSDAVFVMTIHFFA
jgi:hypothetical protein